MTVTGSPRYGGMEPLNAMFDGRRNIAHKPVIDTILNPPMHKVYFELTELFFNGLK